MNIKCLIFDIDGTLIARGKDGVEESALKGIEEAREKGIHILIATGRSYFFVHPAIKKQVHPDYYVTVNGTCLIDYNDDIIERHPFDLEAMQGLTAFAKEHNLLIGYKYDTYIIAPWKPIEFATAYIGDPSKFHFIKDGQTPIYAKELEKPALGAFLFASDELGSIAKETLSGLNITVAYKGAFDIFPSGVDKTKTIESVLEKYNVTWENVMSFGDGENDVEMLQKAKIGVAMGNASDYVKSHADYVTTHILEDGIFTALKNNQVI